MKIDNSLTIYPAPIISSISPTSFIPNETKQITIQGDFLTPATFVEIENFSISFINFINSKEIEATVTSNGIEGSFDLFISNGTKVTYNNFISVFLGTVYPLLSTNYISKTSNYDINDFSEIILNNSNNLGGNVVWKTIDTSKDFQLRFQLRRSIYNTSGGANRNNKFFNLVDDSTNQSYFYVELKTTDYKYAYYKDSSGARIFTEFGYFLGIKDKDVTEPSNALILEIKNGYIGIRKMDGSLIKSTLLTNLATSLPANLRIELNPFGSDMVGVKHIELPTT